MGDFTCGCTYHACDEHLGVTVAAVCAGLRETSWAVEPYIVLAEQNVLAEEGLAEQVAANRIRLDMHFARLAEFDSRIMALEGQSGQLDTHRVELTNLARGLAALRLKLKGVEGLLPAIRVLENGLERHKGWAEQHRDLLIGFSKRIRELEQKGE